MAIMLLERGMTQAEFEDYLRASEDLKELVGTLGAGVDSDVLLDTIKDATSAQTQACSKCSS